MNAVRIQRAIAGVLVLLTAIVGIRLWCIAGLIRPARVEGPSMAPTLLGAHYRVTCSDCRFEFPCDAVSVPGNRLAVCPNCGFSENEFSQAVFNSGQRMLVDRWPIFWTSPNRSGVVAAVDPVSPDELIIKRVAGLPGEQIEIRGGDLFAGGEIIRKSLPQLREVRQLLHDNAFYPQKTSALPARWQGATAESQWQAMAGGFRLVPHPSPLPEGEGTSQPMDWLRYHHWRCVGGPGPRTALSPVLDNDSYNQAESRELNEVADLLLACRLRLVGQGAFALAIRDGGQRFVVSLEPAMKRAVLTENGKEVRQAVIGRSLNATPVRVEFGLCDQQVLLAIQGRTVFRHAYQTLKKPRPSVLHPIEVGAQKLEVEISDLQVWRDIYYLEPLGTGRPWRAEQALGPSEYALLGDNPPVSDDSRIWREPAVGRSRLIGLVVRPFWNADASY